MAVSACTHHSIDAGRSLMAFDGWSLPWHVHETVSMLMLLLLVTMTQQWQMQFQMLACTLLQAVLC